MEAAITAVETGTIRIFKSPPRHDNGFRSVFDWIGIISDFSVTQQIFDPLQTKGKQGAGAAGEGIPTGRTAALGATAPLLTQHEHYRNKRPMTLTHIAQQRFTEC